MTVGELIEELKKHDPSRLVCVDNLRAKMGLYPASDLVFEYYVEGAQSIGESEDE